MRQNHRKRCGGKQRIVVPDVHSSAYATQIEKLYKESMMGQSFSVAYNSLAAPDLTPALDEFPNYCMMMRSQQPIVDIVLRPLQKYIKLCVPHLKVSYAEKDPSQREHLLAESQLEERLQQIHTRQMSGADPSTTKWTLKEKCSASLAHSIAYAVLKCHRDYVGILIPFAVSTESCSDHANMIYIDMSDRSHPSTCILFEPNGVAFSKKYGNDDKFRTEVSRACALLQKLTPKLDAAHLLDDKVQISGGDGIQTALGVVQTRSTASGTLTTKQGHPICAAITYWMFYIWAKSYRSKYPVYTRFVSIMLRVIQKNTAIRDTLKRKLFSFIHVVRDRVAATFRDQIIQLYKEAFEQHLNQHDAVKEMMKRPVPFQHTATITLDMKPFKMQENAPTNCKVQLHISVSNDGVRVQSA